MAQIQLCDFDITENAFLPSTSPLTCLNNEYYAPWESIAQHLPSLIRQRALRRKAVQLPILTVEKLTSEPEWRRAHTLLIFIAHAYIWGGDEPEEVGYSSGSIPKASAKCCHKTVETTVTNL
jgi:indoleamine 2,3-dioxygenase